MSDKPTKPPKGSSKERRLKYWNDLRAWLHGRVTQLNKSIPKKRRMVVAASKKVDKLKAKLKKKRKSKQGKVVVQSGSPHWGGSDDILENEVDPLVVRHRGVGPTSAKRTETYGNPGSDHHVSQVNASARDYPLSADYDMGNKIKQALTGDPNARMVDYESFYIERAGRTYRVQIIAATHGTGPHLHVGIELVG